MSGGIEISREQLEYWCSMLRSGLPETVESMIQTVIAAPVVERQEPVAVADLLAYHRTAVENLNGYAEDSGLRDSDVKHYRKRAAFHAEFVATLERLQS